MYGEDCILKKETCIIHGHWDATNCQHIIGLGHPDAAGDFNKLALRDASKAMENKVQMVMRDIWD